MKKTLWRGGLDLDYILIVINFINKKKSMCSKKYYVGIITT